MRELVGGGALGVVVGLALGALFFGGLWFTVRRGVTSRLAPLWFFVSLLVRLAIALAVFSWIGREQPARLVGALLGFIIARFIVLRATRTMPLVPPAAVTREAHRGA
jgi:F1F0 ATPase subunit 2